VLLSLLFLREARQRPTFVLQQLEARFERGGTFVGQRLPRNALVITTSHSGSVRFYGGRKTLLWDGLDPAVLDRALMYVRAKGYEPYLLFERAREPDFRQRFAGSAIAQARLGRRWPRIASAGPIYRRTTAIATFKVRSRPTEFVP
jgi:hypothetical protein